LVSSRAAEIQHRATSFVGGDEAVVLLGGDAGHWLEEVRVVGRAFFDGPVLHRAGDGVGDRWVERVAELDRLLQRLEHRLGQTGLLYFFMKTLAPKMSLA